MPWYQVLSPADTATACRQLHLKQAQVRTGQRSRLLAWKETERQRFQKGFLPNCRHRYTRRAGEQPDRICERQVSCFMSTSHQGCPCASNAYLARKIAPCAYGETGTQSIVVTGISVTRLMPGQVMRSGLKVTACRHSRRCLKSYRKASIRRLQHEPCSYAMTDSTWKAVDMYICLLACCQLDTTYWFQA